jgi:hypothetical protein
MIPTQGLGLDGSAVTYSVQWPTFGAYKKFSGIVTMPELLGSLALVHSHPDFDNFKFTITDFLDVESIDFKESDMSLYGAQVIAGQVSNRELAIGIVVTDPAIIHLLKTRYERLVRYPVGYFATLEECSKWVSDKAGVSVELSGTQ